MADAKKEAPKNPTLTDAIAKIGGQMEVAYRMKVHLSTVYDWDKAGRVRDSLDAVQFVRLAAKHGVELTVDQIASPADGQRPGPRRGRKPGGSTGSFPCSSAERKRLAKLAASRRHDAARVPVSALAMAS